MDGFLIFGRAEIAPYLRIALILQKKIPHSHTQTIATPTDATTLQSGTPNTSSLGEFTISTTYQVTTGILGGPNLSRSLLVQHQGQTTS